MGRPKTGHSAPQYHDRKVPILMPKTRQRLSPQPGYSD
ncbi:hypothetical protein BAA13334_I00911 [Brucella abortus A13334]|nr:hypothetical protein BAbS19_I18050 [Brucella abortus S19]AEW16931.1 hypothetical protein BAA13334_I00911 [Brucella abortus A13334]